MCTIPVPSVLETKSAATTLYVFFLHSDFSKLRIRGSYSKPTRPLPESVIRSGTSPNTFAAKLEAKINLSSPTEYILYSSSSLIARHKFAGKVQGVVVQASNLAPFSFPSLTISNFTYAEGSVTV